MTRSLLEYQSNISPSANIKEKVELEHPVEIGPHTFFLSGRLGCYSFINWSCQIFDEVEIGRFSTLARNIVIAGADHPTSWLSTSFAFVQSHQFSKSTNLRSVNRLKHSNSKKTVIGNDVWIGSNSIILKGVNVESGAVIGAGSVVTKDVGPYEIWAGNPASYIRHRFDHETISALLEVKWWDRRLEELANLPFSDVASCVKQLRKSSVG